MSRLLPVVMLTTGFGLGAWYDHGNPATIQLTARRDDVVLTSADVSTLRALIREELALAKKDGATPVAPSPTATPNSPDMTEEHRNALADIDGLIAGGVWGNGQRLRFYNDLRTLDVAERQRALRQLASGINSGVIKIHGRPL